MTIAAGSTEWREAILLACSGLGAGRVGPSAVEPLGPKGWTTLASRLGPADLSSSELFELGALGLVARLGYSAADGERLERLFARRAQVALELERLDRLGLWAITIVDDGYPARLSERLGSQAPPVIFGGGDRQLLFVPGVAIVGSRDADEAALEFSADVASAAAGQQLATVSGGARGVDARAMRAAFESGGVVMGVLAESLEARVRQPSTRDALAQGAVVLITPYRPSAPFSVGAAMGRNKIVYGLSDLAVVVSSAEGSGGTWAGAIEAIEHRWVPVFAWSGESGEARNAALMRRGARPVGRESIDDLRALAEVDPPVTAAAGTQDLEIGQQALFDDL